MILAEVAQRAFSRHGLDAPYARRHASLFQNLDQPDLARSAGMGAAAEFRGKIANLDHAHLVAILLAKQRHRVILVDRHVNRNVLDDLTPLVAQTFFVDDVFNVLQLFVSNTGEVGEIKAQMIGSNQRPRLLDMFAKNFAQSRLQKVRSRVIAHGGLANRGIDNGIHFLPNAEGAPPFRVFCGGWGFHINLMRPHALHRVVASSHFSDDGIVIVGVEPSAIANLAAGFGVKGRVIKDDLAGLAGLKFLRPQAALDDGEHFAIVRASLTIAFEVRLRELLIGGIGCLLGRTFPGGASALPLLTHSTVEASLVELNADISNRFLNEIQRQAECIVNLERLLAGIDIRMLRSQDSYVVIEFLHPLVNGMGKTFLFCVYNLGNAAFALNKLRISVLHYLNDLVDHLK